MQAKNDKTFDVVYIITPSFNSNRAYFGKYIRPENVFDPTSASIQQVIDRVEADRTMDSPARLQEIRGSKPSSRASACHSR